MCANSFGRVNAVVIYLVRRIATTQRAKPEGSIAETYKKYKFTGKIDPASYGNVS